ncbi:universal stress protein [Actinosynnema sp. NPDC023587]|uniref:universal stress protein n=1 Tax=Actinosynnema sp. NPDC023587 TaxID=3154695 RepID=UPI0033DA2179
MANDIDVRPIVVGVDGSPASRAALNWAVVEAERRRCPVEAVLAWQEDCGMVIGAIPFGVLAAMTSHGMDEVGRRVLDDAIAELHTDVEVRAVLTADDPRHALTQASGNAVLLVVGRATAGPIRPALLGSVSRYCVRHASCPVVVLRDPAEHARAAPRPALSGAML